jgi:hypothetical protein
MLQDRRPIRSLYESEPLAVLNESRVVCSTYMRGREAYTEGYSNIIPLHRTPAGESVKFISRSSFHTYMFMDDHSSYNKP